MKKEKTGQRTLLMSVVMSSPGVIVMGISLYFGRSSTQLADFVRRAAELAAILVSWFVYRAVHKDDNIHDVDDTRKERLELLANRCVGGAMCVSGVIMILIALLVKGAEKGNVIPGIAIAILGVVTNGWFWLRYRKLNHEKPDTILAAQSKLYRAKSFVDACVLLTLSFVAAMPDAGLTQYIDIAGSIVVALYLVYSGIMILREKGTQTG
ncbi:cation transporter [Oscillospiraceae bacterium OttesenSCG-928-F05]|nr:cation transporter [Oscillospiraceae bacterium OttesenSCG-928-F05]